MEQDPPKKSEELKEKELDDVWAEIKGIIAIACHQPRHLLPYILAQDSSLRNLIKKYGK